MSQIEPLPVHLSVETSQNGGANAFPPAPQWLTERGGKIYDALTVLLTERGVAGQDDSFMIGVLASRIEEVEETSAIIDEHGLTYEAKGFDGSIVRRQRPEVAQRNDALRHVQSLLNEFGLSPASRARMQSMASLTNAAASPSDET